MMKADPRAARILVVGDSEVEVRDACERLAAEFGNVESSADARARALDVERFAPDVLLLVFAAPESAEGCLHELVGAAPAPFRSIVLCAVEQVPACAALCRQGRFDDYVVVGRQVHDPHRLPTAVWLAARRQPLRPKAQPAEQRAPRPRVLVVEDDPFAAKLVVAALAAEGVDADVAGDAVQARSKLRESHPVAILMDVNLPGTDGLALTEYLKANPALAHIPVIMATGEAKREVIARSIALGAVGFIVKPLTRESLMSKLGPYVR